MKPKWDDKSNDSQMRYLFIGRIEILTYLIWGTLGAAIFVCVIRSCDLFDRFIRTCYGPTVIPAVSTSLELFCVSTTEVFFQ